MAAREANTLGITGGQVTFVLEYSRYLTGISDFSLIFPQNHEPAALSHQAPIALADSGVNGRLVGLPECDL